MATITGANATIFLSIAGVFNTPQQLQGFAADDVFDTDPIATAEILMGVDGRMSAGFVFVPVVQNYSLQADSPSMFIFDEWIAAEAAARDLFFASGIVVLPQLGQKWQMTRGALTNFKPTPDVKKLTGPRKFGITWESMSQAAA